MIRTLIRHSQRLAGLMLLAAIAVTGASAQTRSEKTLDAKPAERVVETDKTAVRRVADQQEGQVKTTEAELKRQRSGQRAADQPGIAVGEPNGGSYKKKEVVEAAKGERGRPSGDGEKVEATGGPVRGSGSLDGPLKPAVPQKTKDAIGSPQKPKQKPEAEVLIEKREAGAGSRSRTDFEPAVPQKPKQKPEAEILIEKREAGAGSRAEAGLNKKTNVEPAVPQKTKDAIGSPQKPKAKVETGRLADTEEVFIALPTDGKKVKRTAKEDKPAPAPVGGISEPARRQRKQ